jgi:hypothetical protein
LERWLAGPGSSEVAAPPGLLLFHDLSLLPLYLGVACDSKVSFREKPDDAL